MGIEVEDMIVKKAYSKVKCKYWDKKRHTFEVVDVTNCIGWFLFGIIPIYLIELEKYSNVDFEESGKGTVRNVFVDRFREHLI